MKIIVLIVMLFISNLSADAFNDANQAYKNGDYKKTSELMEKACNTGHMRACWNLGLLYSNGRGVNRDEKKALSLYKKACDGGFENGCTSYDIYKDSNFQ